MDIVATVNALHAKIASGSHAGISKCYTIGLSSAGETVLACAASGSNVICTGFAEVDGTYGSTDRTLNVHTEDHVREGRATGWTGLTPGQPCYLSTTGGLITQTAPSASGQTRQVVGVATTATNIIIQIGSPSTVA